MALGMLRGIADVGRSPGLRAKPGVSDRTYSRQSLLTTTRCWGRLARTRRPPELGRGAGAHALGRCAQGRGRECCRWTTGGHVSLATAGRTVRCISSSRMRRRRKVCPRKFSVDVAGELVRLDAYCPLPARSGRRRRCAAARHTVREVATFGWERHLSDHRAVGWVSRRAEWTGDGALPPIHRTRRGGSLLLITHCLIWDVTCKMHSGQRDAQGTGAAQLECASRFIRAIEAHRWDAARWGSAGGTHSWRRWWTSPGPRST